MLNGILNINKFFFKFQEKKSLSIGRIHLLNLENLQEVNKLCYQFNKYINFISWLLIISQINITKY